MEENYVEESIPKKNTLLTKTYLWMFIALIITATISFTYPSILIHFNLEKIYYPTMYGSIIYIFLGTLLIHISAILEKDKGILCSIAFILYSFAMGILLSIVFLVYDPYIILTSAGISGLIFLGLAIYGTLSKSNHFGLGVFAFSALIGALVLSLINVFIGSWGISYVIELIILFSILAYIIFDSNRVMRLAEANCDSKNIAIVLAFNLYTDFIYLFMRILSIVARNRN